MNRDKEYIRNGYWFMCVSVLMFLVLFHFGSSQLVESPYSSVNDLYNKDQIFPKLSVNDKDTLHAEFKVLNPLISAVDFGKSSLNVLEIDFTKVCGDVIDYTFEYKTNCTKEIKTPVFKKVEVCGIKKEELYLPYYFQNETVNETVNDCYIEDIIDYYITSYETYECWQETDKLPIGVRDYKIKVLPKISNCGDSWGYKIDWVPTLKTTNKLTGEVSLITKEEWAWFNSTWKYRRAINISENTGNNVTNYPFKIALNSSNFNFSLANTTGKDLRLAYENGSLLAIYNESYNSTHAEIWTKLNLTANSNTTIYLYYGNPSANSVFNAESVFGTGIISFWDFDGDTKDVISGVNATIVNDVTLTDDRDGNANSAYYFQGTTDYMVISHDNKYEVDNISLAVWVKPKSGGTTAQGHGKVLCFPYGSGWSSPYASYSFGAFDTSASDFEITNFHAYSSTNFQEILYGSQYIPNTWQFWVYTIDDSNITMRINNTVDVSSASSGKPYYSANDQNLVIGSHSSTSGQQYENYYGDMDRLMMYNKTLSSTEKSNLYVTSEPTISYFGDMENGTTPEDNSFKIYAYNLYDDSAIDTFNISLITTVGTYNYSTTNGTIITDLNLSDDIFANYSFVAPDFVPITNVNNNAINTSFVIYAYQSRVNFKAWALVTEQEVTPFNVTIDGETESNTADWYLDLGVYNATFSKAGWYNQTLQLNITSNAWYSFNFSDVYDEIWSVYAVDQDGNNLTEFEVNLSNSEYSWLDMQYTYVGVVDVAVLSELDYNLSFASVEDGGYLPRTYLDQSTASDFVAELHQAEIRFNLTDINSGTPLTPILINNVLSNLTEASSQSNTWSIKKVFQTNATLVPYATSTLRMSRADYSAELIHEFFYNDSSQVNTSTLSTSSLTDVEYTILNPYPDKLVDSVKVWLRRNASSGTAYSNYTYVYSGDEYTGSTIYASAGEQSFYFVLRPYFDLNQTIDILALSNDTIDLEMYTNEIWLYGTRSQVLENFTCTYEGNVMYSNPYRISNILTPASNMTCTKSGFKPATVSPSTSTPANESFYLDELTTTSFPIYVYDERNLTEISNVTLYVFGEEPYVFNWTNSSRTIAVNGSEVTGMLFIKDGYINEEYYIDISEVYSYINVYMLPANASFNTTFTLQDNINTPIRDGFVDIYRFHPSLVSYILVTTAKTDQNGNATIPLELNAFYKVKTRQVLSSIPYNAIDFPFMPASTEFLVRYGLTEAEQNSAIIFMNMVYNLSYSKNGLNQTIFKLTFNDLSGIVRSGCLKVIEKGVTTNIPLCTNCLNASAGEILCVINQSDYVNTISGWGEFDTTTIHSKYNTPAKDVLKEEGYLDLGTAGLFVTFLLTATGLIAGLFISVPVGLMFLVATLILAIGTGLFWMQISSIVSLIILILLIIFKR